MLKLPKYSDCLNFVSALMLVAMFVTFPISLALTNALMFLTLLFWFLSGRWLHGWNYIGRSPVVWMILVLYAWMLLGVTYTSAPAEDWLLHLKKYIKLPAMIVWILLFWSRPILCAYALNAFVAAMTFVTISTWLNVWFQLPWSVTQNQGWGVTHHVFGDYITQNVMMSFFVLLTLSRAQRSVGLLRWGWSLLSFLAALSITHLSQGRTGYILLAVALAVFVLTQMRGRSALIGILAVGASMGGMLVTSDVMLSRFDQAMYEAKQHDADHVSSIGHRLYNYKTTPLLIIKRPIAGWGTGSYHTAICGVLKSASECPLFNWHPHNQYLFFAAEHGLIGLAVYLAMLSAMTWLAIHCADAEVKALLLGVTALLIADGLFNSPLWSARESHFFTLMSSLLVCAALRIRSAST